MSQLLNRDLSELVSAFPSASGIFEKYNLDYCCHGHMSLLDACNGNLVLAENISGELSSAPAEVATINPEKFTPSKLTDWITEHHHQFAREKGESLQEKLERIAQKHGERHPELHVVSYVFRQLQSELDQHMQKEEAILFPWVKRMSEGPVTLHDTSVMNALHMMEIEHEFAGTLSGELRRLTNHFTPPADACPTWISAMQELSEYITDLHRHIHLENNILFPATVKIVQRNS